MSRYAAMRDPARCEYCGGIVSHSRVKGDTSDPMREGAYSASARFFHDECHEAFERRYVTPRHRGPLHADEVPELNRIAPDTGSAP